MFLAFIVLKEINDKMGKIESIFCEKLRKIDPSLTQSKKVLDNEINKKNLEIQKHNIFILDNSFSTLIINFLYSSSFKSFLNFSPIKSFQR